jgi:trk system potassium uptake protein TrkH
MVFMLLAAINFGLHFLVWRKRDPRLYVQATPRSGHSRLFCIGIVLLVALMLWAGGDVRPSLHLHLREAAFEVVSLVTSTGFGIVDYAHWPDFLPILLLLSASSAAAAAPPRAASR